MPPSNLAPHPALLALLDNASWCWGGSVPLLPRPPTALDFHRKFVARNCPCVIRGLQDDWTKFGTFDELAEALGGLQRHVRVSATPTGRGDAVAMHGDGQKVFVKPDERTVPLAELRDFLYPLAPPAAGDVLYLSSQNDSLRQEFPALVDKGFAKNSLPFGDEAFGERALEAPCIGIPRTRTCTAC
jgi:jumonji domain-containing protein 7